MRPIARVEAWSVCPLVTTISCAKTVEPVELLFGVWTRVGLRNHVLGGIWILWGSYEVYGVSSVN